MQTSVKSYADFQGYLHSLKDAVAGYLASGILAKYLPVVIILMVLVPIEVYLVNLHQFPLLDNETDSIDYMIRADGPIFDAHPFFGPAFSWAIRIGETVGFSPFSAGKVVSAVFTLLFVLASWFTLSALGSSGEAFWGTVLVAFNAVTLTRSVSVMSDMMGAALALASIACLVAPQTMTKRTVIVAGMLAGLAYLTRYGYLFLLVVPVITALVRLSRQHKWPGLVGLVGLFSLGFLLITLPWLVYVFQTRGNPFWSMHYRNIAFKMYLKDNSGWNAFPQTIEYNGFLEVIASDPIRFIESWLVTLSELPAALMDLMAPIGLIAGIGFFFWLAKLNSKKTAFLAINILYGLIVSVLWLNVRFLLLFLPLMAACLASLIVLIPGSISGASLVSRTSRFLSKVPLRGVALAIVMISFGLYSMAQVHDHFAREPLEYKLTADWLAAHTSPETSVFAVAPHIPYFGHATFINFRGSGLDDAQLEQLPDILATLQPTYVIYDQRSAARNYPQFRQLLDPAKNPYPDLLQPVFQVNTPRKVVVYQFLPPDGE